MNRSDNLDRIEEGRRASAVDGAFREFIYELVDKSVIQLVQMYRSGDIVHDMLVGKVAEITALQGLLSELETKQRMGIIAAQHEYARDGQEEPDTR